MPLASIRWTFRKKLLRKTKLYISIRFSNGLTHYRKIYFINLVFSSKKINNTKVVELTNMFIPSVVHKPIFYHQKTCA